MIGHLICFVAGMGLAWIAACIMFTALREDEDASDAAPQPPPQPVDHLARLVEGTLATQAELLKLVQVLAVRSAEAEKAVSAVTMLTETPVAVSDVELMPEGNQELNWADLPRDHAKKQLSTLAEMVAGIQTPDGGTMSEP